MTRRSGFLKWFLPAALLFAAGFVVSTLYDLYISQAIHHPSSKPAAVLEAVGWLPAFVPVLLYVMLWSARPKHRLRRPWQPVLGYVVVLGGAVALFWKAGGYMQHRAIMNQWPIYLLMAAGMVALLAFALKATPGTRAKMEFWALFGCVFAVSNQLLIYALKTLWQRTRFDTMMLAGNGFGDFTPWFRPFGNGGSSFPSGHTANMMGILMLLVLCDLFASWNRHRFWVYLGCWAMIAGMGFSRVWIGRHYLSDTLAAAALVGMLFYMLRQTGFYKQGLRQAEEEASYYKRHPEKRKQ